MTKRLIIKIGTKVLTKDDGRTDTKTFNRLVDEIASLKNDGNEIVLISSGAMGFGRVILGAEATPTETVADKQVFATVGQVHLMERYSAQFKKYNLHCAQLLVTKEDFKDRDHYHYMRSCLNNLLSAGVIPIVNENDAIAIKELIFTDNDELAGLLAAQLGADGVIILSSVNGILDRAPSDPEAKTIPEITQDKVEEVEQYITADKTSVGRGGMTSKFSVAKKLMTAGIPVYLANGKSEGSIAGILAGSTNGTQFIPHKKTSNVKSRLAHSEGLSTGAVVVNDCTTKMFEEKDRVFSLLPVGITEVIGDFEKGDVIEIRNNRKEKIGFGIAAYDSKRAAQCAGEKDERPIIHYDYLFIE